MLREELITFRRGSIDSSSICLRKCVDKVSSTQVDDFDEEICEINLIA